MDASAGWQAQIFGRWGKWTILRYCQEASLASSSQIAARLRRPELSTVTPLGLEEMELLTATVRRLESKFGELENDCSRGALRDLRRPERSQSCEGSDEEDHEAPPSAKSLRPSSDLAAALRVGNYDFDRHSEANRGLVGVVHVAKVYGPEMPQALWKARCGWRFGRKACKDGKAWRILKADEDLAPYGVCDRCAAP